MSSNPTNQLPSAPQPSCAGDGRTKAVRRLNDALRVRGRGGRVVITPGIRELPTPMITAIMQAVRTFDAFTADNDPYGEHDFGAIEIDGRTVFWKIDAYDLLLTTGSPDPTDPTVTHRILTIMLASEY